MCSGRMKKNISFLSVFVIVCAISVALIFFSLHVSRGQWNKANEAVLSQDLERQFIVEQLPFADSSNVNAKESPKLDHQPKNPEDLIVPTNPNKIFVYLLQTESCLYPHLASPAALGDPNGCRCDVLVLSFKKKCPSNPLPHVEYFFDPKSTWTTGRNFLHKTVMERTEKYLYYTFMDNDIQLHFRGSKHTETNPWREYENSLIEVQPLIGVSWADRTDRIFHKYYEGGCEYPDNLKFLHFLWYDALFNSFHWKIVNYLLPYRSDKDSISLWWSQLEMIIKTDLMFPGQVHIHLHVVAGNPQHTPYARTPYNGDTARLFATDLVQAMPQKYRELLRPSAQGWIDDWANNINAKEWGFPNYCLDVPVIQKDVTPYLYLLKDHT